MEGPALGPVFPRNVPRPQRPPTALPGTNVEKPMHYRWRKLYVGSMSEIFVEEDALVVGEWNTGTNGKQWYYHRGDANTHPAAWHPLPPWSWPSLVNVSLRAHGVEDSQFNELSADLVSAVN